jgi:hypothetical protein
MPFIDEFCPTKRLSALVQTWFCSFRSTEAMMRGSANEGAVVAELPSKPFVKAVYECGMLARSDADRMACSSDGIALINVSDLGVVGDVSSTGNALPARYEIASIEIKTSVARSSLDRELGRATVDVLTCTVGDATFRELVPTEHMGQIIHQMLVLSVNYVIYMPAAEVGIMYILVVQLSDDIRQLLGGALHRGVEVSLSWAHDEDEPPPSFADRGFPLYHTRASSILAYGEKARQG